MALAPLIDSKSNLVPLRQIREASSPPKSIAISSNGRIDIVRSNEIMYLRSESNYTHLYTKVGTHHIACVTLRLFEDHLGSGFMRIHNRYLVNKEFITAYLKDTGDLILKDDLRVPVSRKKKAVVMDYFKSLMVRS